MTRVLIAYDASDAARAALAAAAALFPAAETIVVTVHPPSPEPESAGMARVALPESVIREGLENMRSEHEREAQETADAGAAAFAFLAGHEAGTAIVPGASAWRALRDEAVRSEADVLVCGTHAKSRLDRWMLGSTASSLVHHLELPLLIVPEGEADFAGPVMAGYDDSEGARAALRFAAAHLGARPVVVGHGWQSPTRHTLRGHALAGSRVGVLEEYAKAVDEVAAEVAQDTAAEGAAFARELGLDASVGDVRVRSRRVARAARRRARGAGGRGAGRLARPRRGRVDRPRVRGVRPRARRLAPGPGGSRGWRRKRPAERDELTSPRWGAVSSVRPRRPRRSESPGNARRPGRSRHGDRRRP